LPLALWAMPCQGLSENIMKQGPEHGMSRRRPVPLRGFILGPSPAAQPCVRPLALTGEGNQRGDRRGQAGQDKVQAINKKKIKRPAGRNDPSEDDMGKRIAK
jgi:hypothetical protein